MHTVDVSCSRPHAGQMLLRKPAPLPAAQHVSRSTSHMAPPPPPHAHAPSPSLLPLCLLPTTGWAWARATSPAWLQTCTIGRCRRSCSRAAQCWPSAALASTRHARSRQVSELRSSAACLCPRTSVPAACRASSVHCTACCAEPCGGSPEQRPQHAATQRHFCTCSACKPYAHAKFTTTMAHGGGKPAARTAPYQHCQAV